MNDYTPTSEEVRTGHPSRTARSHMSRRIARTGRSKMDSFISELKASWVGSRIGKFHQSTRGIMTPEERQALEAEFDRKLAEHDREVAEKARGGGIT